MNELIIADGHVHFHDCFKTEEFLLSALNNFATAVQSFNHTSGGKAFIFLTEVAGTNSFQDFINITEDNKFTSLNNKILQIDKTSEEVSLKISSYRSMDIFLIAGRQIICAENLEVLALGIRKEFPDGGALSDIIKRILTEGGLPVIPWGFGKWRGKRKEKILQLIKNNSSKVFLADNSNRSKYLRYPPILRLAEEKGNKVLFGTDPLPFPSENKRVGKAGFYFNGVVDPEFPFQSFKNHLLDKNISIHRYGPLEEVYQFLINQSKMQLRKRLSF